MNATVNLDPLVVIGKVRDQAAADYSRALVDMAMLRTELEYLHKTLHETSVAVMTAVNGPEDAYALALKTLGESLVKWNQED